MNDHLANTRHHSNDADDLVPAGPPCAYAPPALTDDAPTDPADLVPDPLLAAHPAKTTPPPAPKPARPTAPLAGPPTTNRRTGVPTPDRAGSLSSSLLLPRRRPVPEHGWRSTVYRLSGGHLNLGQSTAELRAAELTARARTPIPGGYHLVAVVSIKGGVGKTTTVVGLGATLASVRYDNIIAVDCNPDRGTLGDRVHLQTTSTVRDVLDQRHSITRRAQIRAFTSQASSRLEILASDQDPAVSEAFSDTDFRNVAALLETHYAVALADCGTGLQHSAMRGVLGLADQLVLVTSPSVDGARSASATLDWLDAHGHQDLVAAAVVVLSMVRSRGPVDLNALENHFADRCRQIIRIPYDPHLEEGAEVDLDQLKPRTRDAYLALAAAVAAGFTTQTAP